MRINRLAVISVGAAVAFAAAAAPASGHVRVRDTSPNRGGSASTSIRSVTVTFTGPLRRGTLRVTRNGGGTASVGSGGRDPRRISRLRVGLRRGLRAGRYTARYTLVAADGHAQRGSFRFRLRG
jgi:methionine-rich copper-binding protein CopC